jgi:predicted O-methyltransferase YrrM
MPCPLHSFLRMIRHFLAPILRGTRFGSLDAERIDGWTTRAELNWLWRQAKRRAIIVEIGSWKGRSTYALASATPGVLFFVEHLQGSQDDGGKSYHSVDSSEGVDSLREKLLSNLASFIRDGRAIMLEMKSAAAAIAIAPILQHRRADMIFIDADHSYEGAAADIQIWKPYLKPGGLLCGHDADWPSVRRALDEFVPGWQAGPGSIWYIVT